MKLYINKLNEIKSSLKSENNNSISTEYFKSLINRAKAIVDKKYGANSNYSKELERMHENVWFTPTDGQTRALAGMIDIIIDDIELSDKKEDETTPSINHLPNNMQTSSETIIHNNKIFIVHGHNEAMKQSVARTVEKLKLHPIILHEQTNRGQTVIEKFLSHSNVGFAIVLLSADDMGYAIKQGPNSAKRRARQNVIFELGFFTAKIGRKRVVALVEGKDFELPSDIHGVIYISYDGDTGKWKYEVAKELMDSGYELNINNII